MAGVKLGLLMTEQDCRIELEVVQDTYCGAEMEKAVQNWAALSSGRIVPTEARPSELSGCIVGAGDGGVKAKSARK
jgi:hypothetical protein